MITAVVLIFVLVFIIWPEAQVKLELQMRQRLPKLYLLTFRSIRRYHLDIENRFPNQSRPKQLRWHRAIGRPYTTIPCRALLAFHGYGFVRRWDVQPNR